MTMLTTPLAADLRVLIARRRAKVYRVAAEIGVHPTRLSAVLNERVELTPAFAARVLRALGEEPPSA
jgi:plasmid maintenance system antidote protein VapI